VQPRVRNGLALAAGAVLVAALAVTAVGAVTGADRSEAARRVETGTITVPIKGLAFTRGRRTVAVGTTVVWTNHDGTPHTVTAGDGTTFASPSVAPGKAYSRTFSKRGTFEFYCSVHPFMRGTISVVLPYGMEPK
jgi:plastocyanin